jgi:hypothetical protein
MIDPVIAQLVERRTVEKKKKKKKKKEKIYLKSARFCFDQTKMFPFFSSYRFTTDYMNLLQLMLFIQ